MVFLRSVAALGALITVVACHNVFPARSTTVDAIQGYGYETAIDSSSALSFFKPGPHTTQTGSTFMTSSITVASPAESIAPVLTEIRSRETSTCSVSLFAASGEHTSMTATPHTTSIIEHESTTSYAAAGSSLKGPPPVATPSSTVVSKSQSKPLSSTLSQSTMLQDTTTATTAGGTDTILSGAPDSLSSIGTTPIFIPPLASDTSQAGETSSWLKSNTPLSQSPLSQAPHVTTSSIGNEPTSTQNEPSTPPSTGTLSPPVLPSSLPPQPTPSTSAVTPPLPSMGSIPSSWSGTLGSGASTPPETPFSKPRPSTWTPPRASARSSAQISPSVSSPNPLTIQPTQSTGTLPTAATGSQAQSSGSESVPPPGLSLSLPPPTTRTLRQVHESTTATFSDYTLTLPPSYIFPVIETTSTTINGAEETASAVALVRPIIWVYLWRNWFKNDAHRQEYIKYIENTEKDVEAVWGESEGHSEPSKDDCVKTKLPLLNLIELIGCALQNFKDLVGIVHTINPPIDEFNIEMDELKDITDAIMKIIEGNDQKPTESAPRSAASSPSRTSSSSSCSISITASYESIFCTVTVGTTTSLNAAATSVRDKRQVVSPQPEGCTTIVYQTITACSATGTTATSTATARLPY